MKEFLEEIEKNGELKAKVEELNRRPDSTSADFIALAKEYGYTLTEADFISAEKSNDELREDELDAVAGGAWDPWFCCCSNPGTGNEQILAKC